MFFVWTMVMHQPGRVTRRQEKRLVKDPVVAMDTEGETEADIERPRRNGSIQGW